MDDRAGRDALRDVVALIAANMHSEDAGTEVAPLAQSVVALRDDEPLAEWHDRIAVSLAVATNLASSFLAQWAGTTPIAAPDLLRIFAERLETEMTRRDLASGD
jgi:hypothetical protein